MIIFFNWINGQFVCFVFFIQGTEVKAITYSAMQIYDNEKPEIFAIVDI